MVYTGLVLDNTKFWWDELSLKSQQPPKILGIKASPAQVLLAHPSWIHKVPYIKCAQSTLSCLHIVPK